MPVKTKIALANSLMTLGLLPYLVVAGYLAWTSGARGDSAMTALLMAGSGWAFSYVTALTIAFPAFLWSCLLKRQTGTDTRHARMLRLGVMVGVFPLLPILPALALVFLA